jgi:GDP-4-dehydro-6-deoxy-D-mannose reductase
MKALVTGASGFVGRHLVAYLRAAGDDVAVIDHAGADPVDVTDAGAVRRTLGVHRPDAVYHLAGVSHVGGSWDAPARVFRVNAEGTLHVLHACADAGVARVLVVGSADEYGTVDQRHLPLDEEAPLRPLTPYGASKVAADFLALRAFLGEGLPTLRVRAFNHTGPGQSSRFVVPGLAHRIAAAERDGRSEIGVGALDTVRDFTDVRDVVRAYRLLVERGTAGEAYNVCSGRGFSVSEIAGLLIGLSDHELRVVVDPALVRPVEVPRLVGDPTKLRAATSWEPVIPFEQTLADVLGEARLQPAAGAG